jgi:hypothetical protein
MEIRWTYDNPSGGTFDVDPEDFCGMTLEQISNELHLRAKQRCKREAVCYVNDLDEIAAEVLAKANESELEDDHE